MAHTDATSPGSSRVGRVEYATAWMDQTHKRHLGRAWVEDGELVLDGVAPGSPRRRLRLAGGDISRVDLHRWGPTPAVAISSSHGEVTVELLLGGWGAAHQLANAVAGLAADQPAEEGDVMTDQIAILAQIRPGKRADLERALGEGPPFDLENQGFEHHEVFLGDSDVVFVFTGPGAVSQLRRMAATPDMFRHLIRMTDLLAAPRLLQQTFNWDKRGDQTNGHRVARP